MKKFISETGAGFLVCVIISIISQYIAKFFPTIGTALFAIGIGIVCGNTFLNRECFDKGTKFSEKNLLEYSIVLTGATLILGDIIALGVSGVIFIILQMWTTISIAYIIGRKIGFNKKFSLLMGAGNAVCGSSAIATVSPVINADTKEKGISITVVNVTGTILMVLLPLITKIIYHHEVLRTSAMIGGILQSIGQVIAGAQMVNEEVTEISTIFKIIRIIFIVGVALFYSHMDSENNNSPLFKKNTKHKDNKIKINIPWFIIGFFIMATLHTMGIFPHWLSAGAKLISQQFEIIALGAIGMRVKFKDLVTEGPKAMIYGLGVGTCQIIFAMTFIKLIFR